MLTQLLTMTATHKFPSRVVVLHRLGHNQSRGGQAQRDEPEKVAETNQYVLLEPHLSQDYLKNHGRTKITEGYNLPLKAKEGIASNLEENHNQVYPAHL